MKGNLDMENDSTKVKNKIINLGNGIDNDDAVNLAQLKSYTDSHQNNYNLQPSFTFYKNLSNQARLSQPNLNIPNHNHHDLLMMKKEGFSAEFGCYAWASLQMANNLPAGYYTSVFETFSAIITSLSQINLLNIETLITEVYGHGGYQTTHSKSFIYFKSNGQPGLINFQIRYYGSSYNNSGVKFLFFARVLAGRQLVAFNHALFDVNEVQLKDHILYFDDIQMNDNKIKGLAEPSEDSHATNMKYVNDQIAKLPHSDNGTLKLDGSQAMTGNLNVGGFRITNLKYFVEDDSSQAASDAQKNDVVNWGKKHEIRGDLKRELNKVASDALNRTNPDPMLSPINMGKNFIDNLKDPGPTDSNYAATINFVKKTISNNNSTTVTNYQKYIDDRLKHSVQSAHTSNAFQYVMDNPASQLTDEDDFKGINKTDKDFHKINKEIYEMQFLLDSKGYYSSRLGVNMYLLPNGEYSLVYELYYPNSIDS